MEILPIAARMASTASVAVLCAIPVFIALHQCAEPADKVRLAKQRLWRVSLAASSVFVLAQLVVMQVQYAQVAALSGAATDDLRALCDFVLSSLPGQVWLVRVLLVTAIFAWLLVSIMRSRSPDAPLSVGVSLVSAAVIALGVFTGHYSGEQAHLLTAHALHLLALSLWVGGLVPWLVFAITLRDEPFEASGFLATMQRFSMLAMASVVIVVLTGMVLAYRFIDTQGDLLGTSWGQWLAVKVMIVAAVMWTANKVRRAMNAGISGKTVNRQGVIAAVSVEFTLVLVVILAASAMSLSTPASHDAAQWWLPFRVSLDAIWGDKPLRYLALSSLVMLGLAGVGLLLARWMGRKTGVVASWWLATVLFGAVAGWSASVPAFPDSFLRSDTTYMAESIASGSELYQQHCQSCHGTGGRGDGPLGKVLPKRPPADLSAPHTALHTAGDMYWWLSHGIPQSGMPGFASALSPQDRWDLVNFLRAFSQGFQARVISGEVVRNDAWLAAPDFNVRDAGSLKRWRGLSPVMVMVGGTPDDVAALYKAMNLSEGSIPLFWVSHMPANAVPRDVYLPQDPAAVETAYALLSRTIDYHGEKQDLLPPVEKSLFVVDGHGYVRARWVWRAGMKAEFDTRSALLAVARLREDTRVPPPPDDHIH